MSSNSPRVMAGLVLGTILGVVGYRVAVGRHGWGKEAYLAWQSGFFDRVYFHVHPFWHYLVAGIVLAGAFLFAYELLKLALRNLMRTRTKTSGA